MVISIDHISLTDFFLISFHLVRCRSAIHAASFSDQGESLQLLLSHHATVNVADQQGRTPLMYAAANGNVTAVGQYTVEILISFSH